MSGSENSEDVGRLGDDFGVFIDDGSDTLFGNGSSVMTLVPEEQF